MRITFVRSILFLFMLLPLVGCIQNTSATTTTSHQKTEMGKPPETTYYVDDNVDGVFEKIIPAEEPVPFHGKEEVRYAIPGNPHPRGAQGRHGRIRAQVPGSHGQGDAPEAGSKASRLAKAPPDEVAGPGTGDTVQHIAGRLRSPLPARIGNRGRGSRGTVRRRRPAAHGCRHAHLSCADTVLPGPHCGYR